MTSDRFSDFYENHISKEDCLMEEFLPLLAQNFNLVGENWGLINGTDFSFMMGGWKNGEISQKMGIAEMIHPENYGKDPRSTVAINEGLKAYLKRWGLFSRVLKRNKCCNQSCGCGVTCETLERKMKQAWGTI